VVKGSVVFDADGEGLRYVVNGGGLAADSYSLVLKSGPAAFHSAFGNLDGNGDGTGGDDYLAAFTLGPVPALRLSCRTSCAARARRSMCRPRPACCR
jgi:hypothetical protein